MFTNQPDYVHKKPAVKTLANKTAMSHLNRGDSTKSRGGALVN